MKNNSILLIGPYPEGNLQHIGGTTILFKNFVDYLHAQSVSFSYISMTGFQGFAATVLNFTYVILAALLKLPKTQIVVLNLNRRGLLYLMPIMYCLARIFKVRIGLRMFGDTTREGLASVNSFFRGILISILKKADLLFFETQSQVEYFKKINQKTFWFPNCRVYPLEFKQKKYNKKFVFISQVKIAKGILLILEVFKNIGSDYSIEIYGPILDDELHYVKDLPCYKGILSFDEVYKVLNNHDVLLLPTFKGEGYPGIIIEAYSMSVPVITSRWNSIPEIVNDGVSGFLIEPNSAASLKEAILKFNEEMYAAMNIGAFEMSKNFQSDDVHKSVLTIIQDTIKTEAQ